MGPLLSASLIVRDEAAVLGACLASIRDVVDEIVVVDTGSVDDSPAIAVEFGADVFHQPWDDDFAKARNAGLDRCHGEWILYIDADERLAPVDRPTVERLLAGAPEVGFRLLLRPIAGWTPYREYRLWRNDPRIRFEGVIHERVVPAIHAVAAADRRGIGECDLLLEHVGYEGDQTRKHRRNLPLLRRQAVADPDNLFVWHHLARVLNGLGEPDEAEAMLERAVSGARAKPFVDPVGALPYCDLIALRLERKEDVTGLLAEAQDRYPGNWILVWLEARSLADRGRFADALARFERLAGVDTTALPDQGPAYDLRLFGEWANDGRALCLFRLERYAEAAEAYAAASACAPADPAYRVKAQLASARAGRPAAS